MNNKIKIIYIVAIFTIIIASIFTYIQNTKKNVVGTYIGHLANDIYVLNIQSEQNGTFTGTLEIRNFEKDSSKGTLKGTYKNGILLAEYIFQSEGVESTGWVAFKKVSNGFIRGYGDIGPETDFNNIDINLLKFDSTVIYELSDKVVNSVLFNCDAKKNIKAVFYKDRVDITLSDGRDISLPQVISASGARYANFNESFVFWNKGNTAFVNEGTTTTFKNCVI